MQSKQHEKVPHLVAVGGLPGTGKSVVARKIAEQLAALLIRTDVVRKDLFPSPTYSDAETEQTYAEFFRRAAAALAAGRSVVLDATFWQRSLRQRARAIAEAQGVPWHFVLVTAPEPLVRQRLDRRLGDASDADFAVYQEFQQSFEPFQQPHSVVRNDGTLADLDRQIEAIVDQWS